MCAFGESAFPRPSKKVEAQILRMLILPEDINTWTLCSSVMCARGAALANEGVNIYSRKFILQGGFELVHSENVLA